MLLVREPQAILARPALAGAGGEAPRLSVTLLLDRNRIEQATIGFELTVAPEPWMLSSLPGGQALCAHRATFRLMRGVAATAPLAESSVMNGQLGTALSATLDRWGALELLDALRGEANALEVTATLEYREPASQGTTLHLSTDLAQVLARLAPLAGEPPILYERDLESYLAALIEAGTVSVEGADLDVGAGTQALAGASLDAFVRACSLYLERLADDERAPQLGRRFLLRGSPPNSMPTRLRVTRAAAVDRLDTVEVCVGLHELLRS